MAESVTACIRFLPYLENDGHVCTVWPISTERLFRAMRSKGKLGTKVLETLYCTVRRLVRIANLSQFDLVVIHREVFPFLAPLMEKAVLLRHPKVVFSYDDESTPATMMSLR